MSNRILKESICTSPEIEHLSWFEEVLFYRLLVHCDDYGRYEGRVGLIKNMLFPISKNVRNAAVEKGMQKLCDEGLIIPYEVNGIPYIQVTTWEKHQRIRAKRSKFPEPCCQLTSNDVICQSNPIQSESESEKQSKSESEYVSEYEPGEMRSIEESLAMLSPTLADVLNKWQAYMKEQKDPLTEKMVGLTAQMMNILKARYSDRDIKKLITDTIKEGKKEIIWEKIEDIRKNRCPEGRENDV